MTSIMVTRDDFGRLVGVSEKDRRAYKKLRSALCELQQGEILSFDYWVPRNGALHRKHFAMLAAIYDAQEQFADPDALRMWLQVGAGHCEFVPGPTGKAVAIPKSIRYSALDDADFEEHHEKVKAFLRSEHARRFLYPHLSDQQSAEMVDAILAGFDE